MSEKITLKKAELTRRKHEASLREAHPAIRHMVIEWKPNIGYTILIYTTKADDYPAELDGIPVKTIVFPITQRNLP